MERDRLPVILAICIAISVSSATWFAIGGNSELGARLYAWIEWFVLEGPAGEAFFAFAVLFGILGVINYARFATWRDIGLLRRALNRGVAGCVAVACSLLVDLVRAFVA